MSDSEDGCSIPVLLLKTKSMPHDGYEEYFFDAGNGSYRPVFIPVLEHRFQAQALSRLEQWLDGKHDQSASKLGERLPYGGIIFTSQRAVEAFSQVVTNLRASDAGVTKYLGPDFVLYVVGPATARGLRTLNLPCDIVGEESGTGEALAHVILQDYANRAHGQDNNKLPLLFLVGEQRRDIIPKTLTSETMSAHERVPVDEVVVYETGEMQSFREDFKRIWTAFAQQGLAEQWVVVFSPTGCRAMLETLDLVDPTTGTIRRDANKFRSTHIATIGPTTKNYLVSEFGLEPDVCAAKPSPEGVGDAIRAFTQRRARTQGLEQNFATQMT